MENCNGRPSSNGDAWAHSTYDFARTKTYRWGEEGIAGMCEEQPLCLAIYIATIDGLMLIMELAEELR